MELDYEDLEAGISESEQTAGIKRVAQIGTGLLLIAAGIAMLVLPGPGLVVIMVGLNLIKPDNAIVRWMRRSIPGIPEDGPVPKKYLALGAGFLICGTVVGLLYGPALTEWARNLVGI